MKIESSYIQIIAIVGLVVALVFLSMSGSNSSVGVAEQRNAISVTGSHEMSVMPDKAYIYANIETSGKTAKESQDLNKEKSNAVINYLKGLKISSDNIETDYYYIYQRDIYEPRTGERKGIEYITTYRLKVSVSDLESVGDIVDGVINAGATGINNIVFDLSKEKREEVNTAVLGLASEKAEEKAKAIAKGLNLHLGKVVSVSESNVNISPYYLNFAMAEKSSGVSTQIMPQMLDVRASISVSYEI